MYFLFRRRFLIVLLVCSNIGSLEASLGEELYEENCAACHGDKGSSILPGTPDFARGERLEKSDDELLKSIEEGLNVMPGWAGIMTHKQIKECLDHARSLSDKGSE